VPRDVFPAVKTTAPSGSSTPLACGIVLITTVAVRTVEALCAIAAGLAMTEVDVGVEVTDTIPAAVELLKAEVAT
jgi:hypothetical protein